MTEQSSRAADNPDLLDTLASLQVSRAAVLRVQGLQAKLEDSLGEAIGHYRTLVQAMPDAPKYAENLALTMTDLGIAKQDHGQSIDAMAILQEASQQWQDLLVLYAEVPRFHEQSAACEDALSQVILDATNQSADAMLHASSSVQTYQELVELSPQTPDYRHRLAVSRSHAAINLLRLERPDDAMLLFDAAEKELRELITESPEVIANKHSLAHVLYHRGTYLAEADKRVDGEPKILESIALWTELANAGHADAANELTAAFLMCPITELRNVSSAVSFANLAGQSSGRNPRYQCNRAIALALSDGVAEAKKLLDEIETEQGGWVGRDFFALAILSCKTGDGKVDEWITKGEAWRQANQPGSVTLRRLHDLAKEQQAGL